MLLMIVCIVYHDVFVSGAVAFDRVVQPSEFAVWQHLFVSFINKLFYKFSRVKLVLECWENICQIRSAWL